jgi:hypothetical protein
MSKWTDILKKNNKEFQTKIVKAEIKVNEETEYIEDHNIKDIDDEFENKYSSVIHDIMFDFKEYIIKNQLPFLNKPNMTGKYLVEDFFKKFTVNYLELKEKVEKENEEYLKELEEEENDLIEENNEYEYKN